MPWVHISKSEIKISYDAYVYVIVHKQMSILTFEGLSTTFEALANVSFAYFSHIFSLLVITYAQKLPTKCFLLILKVLVTHVIVLHKA